jgi:uncharacterized protein YgiM (DUF1202 family)
VASAAVQGPPAPAEPKEGDDQPRYRIKGVVAPDTLNIRGKPDPRSRVVAQVPANGRGITVTGQRRQIGPSLWWEVEHHGQRGWVNSRYLAPQAGD